MSARTSLSDPLQSHVFWLMDVAPIEPLALPIFSPLMGFSGISAPEMTLETTDITEGNWYFRRKVIKHADVGPITLMRSAKWADSDFYRWILSALTGDTGGRGGAGFLAVGGATPRRDLLLVQFLAHSPLPSGGPAEAAAAAGLLALQGTVSGVLGGDVSSRTGAFGVLRGVTNTALTGGLGLAGIGPVEFAPRVPAKAWLLKDCIPTRYKPGSDFDASNAAVSIQELEITPEYWDEISLGTAISPLLTVIEGAVTR